MTNLIEPIAEAVADARALLRIGHGDEDALIADLIGAAAGACELFVGRLLVVRTASEIVAGDGRWHRLATGPVASIDAAERLEADGSATALGPGDYEVDIDARGDGWVKAPGGRPVRVGYEAGLAPEWGDLPDTIRQGVLRLTMFLYLQGAGDEGEPPASVAALWRPWRRMRL